MYFFVVDWLVSWKNFLVVLFNEFELYGILNDGIEFGLNVNKKIGSL